MRRWRKRKISDGDILNFDSESDSREKSKYSSPNRKLLNIHDEDIEDVEEVEDDDEYDDEYDEDGNIAKFNRLEPLVRAGKYKPKSSDPYTVHLLYQSLIELGDIK